MEVRHGNQKQDELQAKMRGKVTLIDDDSSVGRFLTGNAKLDARATVQYKESNDTVAA